MAGMDDPASALDADWLGVCRRAAGELQAMFAAHPTTTERAVGFGRGEGGDETLLVDREAEEAIFEQLERLHAEGHRFSAISEERGEVDFGGGPVRVVIDPIDGSLNAKRGLPHHAMSIAVADGPMMSDVAFGYVFDFGTGEEFSARRGAGAFLNGERLQNLPERRKANGKLEIVAIESADPRWLAPAIEPLGEIAHRLRALGTIAVALCQVAATRVDGLVTLWRVRSVDCAAGQLIVTESGGVVGFGGAEDRRDVELDLVPREPMAAARSERALVELFGVSPSGR
jgi:myo-inositol-1(or 4)-monophosphatase